MFLPLSVMNACCEVPSWQCQYAAPVGQTTLRSWLRPPKEVMPVLMQG
jgi:hypothetical protein